MLFKSQLTRPEKWLKRLFPSVANTRFSSPIPVAQRRVGLYAGPSPHESPNCGRVRLRGLAENRWLQRVLTSVPWLSTAPAPASAHPHCLLCRAHPSVLFPSRPIPSPGQGWRTGCTPSSGVTGGGYQPHCAQEDISPMGQHHPFSQGTPSASLTPDPPQARGFHTQSYRSSLARALHLPKSCSWLKGYAGSGSPAGPDVFPLFGMDEFGNWDCVSPFPKVKKEAEV